MSYGTTRVHERQAGAAGAEPRVVARCNKTDGTAVIDLLAGSVVLEQVTPEVTSIELQEHLRATLRDEQTIAAYLTDLYDETALATHGEPLPNYD